MPAIAPQWEFDTASGSASTVGFTATGTFAPGYSIVLVIENATNAAIVASVTGANGDVFVKDGNYFAPISGVFYETWRCVQSLGGTNVAYLITFNAITLNPRLWVQGFNQQLDFISLTGADSTSPLVFPVTATDIGILVARTPSSWPPSLYTVVGGSGSAHCAQQVYPGSDTETISVNAGSMDASVYSPHVTPPPPGNNPGDSYRLYLNNADRRI